MNISQWIFECVFLVFTVIYYTKINSQIQYSLLKITFEHKYDEHLYNDTHVLISNDDDDGTRDNDLILFLQLFLLYSFRNLDNVMDIASGLS